MTRPPSVAATATSPAAGQPAPISRHAFREQQAAAAKAVTDVLSRVGREFESASELAALLSALPGDTPIHIAETIQASPTGFQRKNND